MGVRYQDGESLEFFIPFCESSELNEVVVEDRTGVVDVDDTGAVLWRLQPEGDGRRHLSRVDFGEAPDGYSVTGLTSIEMLAAGFPDSPLLVRAVSETGVDSIASFRLSELPTDGSALLAEPGDRRHTSVEDVLKHQRNACEPTDAWLRVAYGAILGIPLALLARHWWRRRRQTRQVEVDPLPPPSG